MKLALFVYNFPHKKSQDFLWRLLTEGLKPHLVLAEDYTHLDIPTATFRVKPKHLSLVHPKDICRRFKIPYYVVGHNDKGCIDLLTRNQIDIGVIAGGRILKTPVLRSVKKGIINLHPGLIPEVRGLDALQWAIIENHPLGVTAHVIDERVDAGHILMRNIIQEFKDDTFIDLSLRLYETQLEMLANAINLLEKYPLEHFQIVGKSKLHRKMVPELENELPFRLRERLELSGI